MVDVYDSLIWVSPILAFLLVFLTLIMRRKVDFKVVFYALVSLEIFHGVMMLVIHIIPFFVNDGIGMVLSYILFINIVVKVLVWLALTFYMLTRRGVRCGLEIK